MTPPASSLPHRPFVATVSLVVLNMGAFLWQLANGLSVFDPSPEALLDHGGNLALLTLIDQPWRLFTSLFVHAGVLHLLANMTMLAVMGMQVGRRFKFDGLLAIYFCGGLAASLVSAWWAAAHMVTMVPRRTPFGFVDATQFNLVVSAGASGAIMALCGALAALALRQQLRQGEERIDPGERVLGTSLLQVIGANIALGFFIAGVDQAAHIGGLLAGLVLGFGMASVDPRQRRVVHGLRVVASSVLMLAAVWWALPLARTPELQEARAQWDLDHGIDRQKEAQVAEQAEREVEVEIDRLLAPVQAEQAQGTVLRFGRSGAAMALSGDERQMVVVDHAQNQLSVIELASGQVLRVIKGPSSLPSPYPKEQGGFESMHCLAPMCGPGAAGVALLGASGEPGLALVTSLTSSRSVTQVDLRTGVQMRSLNVGRVPQAIVLSPDQSRAWVHNALDRSLSVIDLQRWAVIKTWPLKSVGSQPVALPLPIWFSPDGSRVHVHSVQDMQVETYDAATLEQLDYQIPAIKIHRTMPHPGLPEQYLSMSLFEIMQMDLKLNPKKTWPFCDPRRGVDFTAVRDQQGRRLVAVVTDEEEAVVHIGHLDSGATLGAHPLPSPSAQMLFSKDGSRLFVLGRAGTLSIIDPTQRMAAAPPLFCRETR